MNLLAAQSLILLIYTSLTLVVSGAAPIISRNQPYSINPSTLNLNANNTREQAQQQSTPTLSKWSKQAPSLAGLSPLETTHLDPKNVTGLLSRVSGNSRRLGPDHDNTEVKILWSPSTNQTEFTTPPDQQYDQNLTGIPRNDFRQKPGTETISSVDTPVTQPPTSIDQWFSTPVTNAVLPSSISPGAQNNFTTSTTISIPSTIDGQSTQVQPALSSPSSVQPPRAFDDTLTSDDDIVSPAQIEYSRLNPTFNTNSSATWTPMIQPVGEQTRQIATIDPVSDIKSTRTETTKLVTSEQNTTMPTVTGTSTLRPTSLAIHPLLIYSIRYEIRSYDLLSNPMKWVNPISSSNGPNSAIFDQQHVGGKHSTSRTLIGGLKNTVGLDFFYSEKESFIYWIDVIEERIYRGAIVNNSITNVDTVVQSGLATAEGLAIDWVGRNIYWVESTLDHIEVANMNGSARRTLIAGDMESPRAIAVDPRYGLLFWSDWDRKSPRIERATMSGDDRRSLVSIKEVHGGWPNGLTLDYEALKVYWIDANSDSIHVVDYEGNNHKLLLNKVKSLGHPFSVTLFENNLYWTDWKTNTVSMANKHLGTDVRELQRQTSRPLDIKVFHPSRQPSVGRDQNPCAINNGNCSHLCLLNTNHSRKCECPHLMRMTQNGLTCETDERVLLIGRANEIRAVDILQPLYHVMAPISVPRVFIPRQFEFDSKSRNIFWADSQTNEVKRSQLAGNVIETIIDVIIESPKGLALDWISGNIYVTSAMTPKSSGKIFISNLNGEFISILMDSNQGINSPSSLAVHPLLGLLFCIDMNEKGEPSIFMASMDGRDKRIIASRSNNPLLWEPSNLAMDFEANRVYWIDQAVGGVADHATIQYYDIALDAIYTLTIDDGTSLPEHRINPNSLCVDGDYLIMSSKHPNEAIIRVKKNDPKDRMIYKTQSLDQILALRVYNASVQVGTNACSKDNGGCSQLCVPISATQRTCKCTMSYTVNAQNEVECIGKNRFLIFSYNLGMKGISLEPNSSSEDYYLPPIHRAFRASSIDFIQRDHIIYWVDNEEGSITRINQDTTKYQVIVQGLESEECIAVDWIAGNIYWLDPYYDIIEVARLNGSNRYVIISGDMEKPNGIVVNPLKGYIAWSDIGSTPKIETALLDGSHRRVIFTSKLSHIGDLSIDYNDDFIYWVDSSQSSVERIRPDGSERMQVFSSPVNNQAPQHHLVSIAIYNEHLYVADSVFNQGSILRLSKNNDQASNIETIQEHLGDSIRDIAIYAEQPLPGVDENPCVKDNGGCQDLCLYLGERGKKRCICSHAKLNSDGLTCRPYDTFILFSKLSQIDSLHIQDDEHFNNSPYPPITIESRTNIVSLTVDYDQRRVIYSEITRAQICSVFFNGTDKRVLVEKQSFVEGIAFANNQLYWTSIHDNSISRLNTSSTGVLDRICDNPNNGSTCGPLSVEKLIQLTQDDKPRGIAIDSCTNYVYWTNWNNDAAAVQRAGPHDNHKIESIITTNIKVPNGIAIDQKRRRLYWCDAKLDKIETCDMDGTNRVVLISSSPQHPFALAIWKNNIYWTDWMARSVFRADKYTGQQVIQIRKVLQRPMGIAVAAGDLLECPTDNCAIDNGNCAPGYTCVTHDTGSGQPYVACRGPDELSHDLALPTRKCKHHLNGDVKSCDMTYQDFIMDNLDRFNLSPMDETRIFPTPEIQEQQQSPMTEPSFGLAQSNGTTSISSSASTVAPISETTHYSAPVQRTQPSKSRISNESHRHPLPPPPPPTSTTTTTSTTRTLSNDSDTQLNTSTVSSPTTSTVVNIAPNSTDQLTRGGSSTLPPCQIVPAAQQSTPTSVEITDDCKSRSQFKCYLSNSLLCISSEKRCDGIFDCPSKEDENDCFLSGRGQYKLKQEAMWHRFVTGILVILAAALAALFLVFGTRSRRRRFVNTCTSAFGHHEMFDDNGTNIEISNPMFDDDDSANLVHCAFSIDLNERTTNFSNPLYERQVLLVNDKNSSTNPST